MQQFTDLVSNCLDSLKARDITPQALTNTILCLKLFDSDDSEESLVVDCKNDLQQATSNAAIFEIAKPYMSYLNPELLAHIIEYLGSDNDRKEYKDYMKALEEHCKVTQVVLPCQPDETMPESEMIFQQVHVVMETAMMTLKSVRNVKSKIANILKLNIAAVQIKSATCGSPLPISFQLVSCACKSVFPLSSEQERGLKSLGILSLGCGDYSFCHGQTPQAQPDQVSEEDEIEIPCLGRPFRVGMFYDCRNDNLILNIGLCKDDVIEVVVEEQSQVSYSCEVLEDDSLETKASSLQLTPPLKLSLMSNLLHDHSKSAKYWNDHCKSKRQVRVCLKYTCTTSKKHLPLRKLREIEHHIFEHATHVVTGVLYGLDAYCVFDHMLRENERFEDIHKNMVTMVKALASSDSTQNAAAVSDCKVYSDLEQIHMFQKVVEKFTKLQSPSAHEKSPPVPKTVWLYPLKKLDNKCKVFTRQVSTDVTNQFQSILEYLHEIEILVNDLLNEHSVTFSRFQHTENRVSKFIEVVSNYRNDLRKQIAKILPSVREGSVDECEITKVIKENSVSPFMFESLNAWLDQMKEEISALEMVMRQVEDVEFVSSHKYQSTTNRELDSDYLVCFAFHIALEEDTVINLLQSYLQSKEVNHHLSKIQLLKWHTKTELMKNLFSNIEHFKTFMESNSENKSTKFTWTSYTPPNSVARSEPSSILLYESTTYKVWEPPGAPSKPIVKEVTHDSVHLEWSKPEQGSQSVECYQVSYHPVDNPQDGSVITTNSAQEMATISGLTAGTKYVFTVQSKCEVGVGSKGEPSDPVETKAAPPNLDINGTNLSSEEATHPSIKSGCHLSSPDLNQTSANAAPSYAVSHVALQNKPIATAVTHNSITLQWAITGYNINDVDSYTILYHPVDDSKKRKRITTDDSEQSIVVSDLSPQTKYIFKVRPELEDATTGAWSEASDPIETKASLCQPGKPTAIAVSHDSITLQWDEPQYDCENVENYLVWYQSMDGPSKKWNRAMTEGTEQILVVSKLSPNTKYIFKVRPEFEDGVGVDSDISDPIETKSVKLEASCVSSADLGKPTPTAITHDSITLQWTKPPENESETIECYTVSYRSVDDAKRKWESLTTETNEETVTIRGLTNDTKYVFKVRSECESDHVGPSSELSEPIPTKATSPPGKPTVSAVTHNSVKLNWSKPEYGSEAVKQYKVLYYPKGDRAERYAENTSQESIVLSSLSTNTTYTFQILPICRGNTGCISEMSDPIKTKPSSPPGKPAAVNVTHNSVTLNWDKPEYGSENVVSYTIQVKCENNFKDLKTKGAQESILVSELDMKTKYQFKVHPECGEAGVGMESETSEVIETMPTSPPGKPTASIVTHDSIQLQWTKPEEQCANIEGYQVWYKKTQNEEHWMQIISSGPSSALNRTISKDFDLDTEYVFKVVPMCNIGKGSESQISDPVRTLSTSPPGKPFTHSQTHNSVQLEWTKPEHGSENIESYTVFVYSGMKFTHVMTRKITNTINTSSSEEKVHSSIGGLTPHTEYFFKVQPYCPSGPGTESELSKPIKTKRVFYKPGKPEVEIITYDKVTINWRKPENGSNKVDSYCVYYCEINDSHEQWKLSRNAITTPRRNQYACTVDSLHPGTKYIFKIESRLITGSVGELYVENESEPSDPIHTKTTTPPGKPVAVSRSYNSIHLEWTAPENGSENIDYYIIRYHEKHKESMTDTSRKNHTVLSELRSKTQYIFIVIPHCHDGEGEPSESNLIETLPSCKSGKPRCVTSESTHDSITLTWKKPEYFARDIDYYSLTYHSKETGEQQNLQVPVSHYTGCIISPLMHNTEYIFKVVPVMKANTAANAIECSISDPIVTMATTPPSKPFKVSITHDKITLQWGVPAIGGERIKFYRIKYYLQKTIRVPALTNRGSDMQLHVTKSAENKATVENLSCSTKYIFKVQAICEGKTKGMESLGMDSDPSDPIETNATSPPGKPIASEIAHNNVTLKWTKPKHGYSSIERYTVSFSIDGKLWQTVPETSCSSNNTYDISSKILGLKPATIYLFQVYPVCTNGTGTYSQVSEPIVTKATAPPGKPTASEVTHNSISVKWDPPSYGCAIIDYYLLFYTELIKGMQTTWKTIKLDREKTECCVDKLERKTQYVFKLRHVCKKGQGEGAESKQSDPIMTKATSPPGKPVATKVTHNSVHLKWEKPEFGDPSTYYTIRYNCIAKQRFSAWDIKGNCHQESFLVEKLQPNTGYRFKVIPKCGSCDGTESEISDVITTYKVCKPGKPTASERTHDSIMLTWTKPHYGNDNIICYGVYFGVSCARDSSSAQWRLYNTQSDETKTLIQHLSHSTQYTFKVRAKLNEETINVGVDFSEEVRIKTKPLPLAINLYNKAQSKGLLISRGSPAVYEVPGMTCTMRDEEKKIAKWHFQDPHVVQGKSEKVLMLVGETGAGKSTLIECMVNYIFGIKWENNFRFQLIKEETRSETESQTRFITAYTFYPVEGSALDYTLTIIDTPGYADTRGIKYDAALTEQIKVFFSTKPADGGIDHIDGVGFVLRASSLRLTATQEYIFESILNIFGKDMEDNIFLMITYCDAQIPKVLKAVGETNIPHAASFKFNNSALYADNSNTSDAISTGFWKMGMDSLSNFFSRFQDMNKIYLLLTKDVLEQRNELENDVERLQKQIKASLGLIRVLQQDEEAIKAHESNVDSNEPFMYEVEVMKAVEEQLPDKEMKVTICLVCNTTCHYPCTISNDEKKYKCKAMKGHYFQRNKDSCCGKCGEGKCHWSTHVNRPYRFVDQTVTERRTLDDLIKQYFSESTGDRQSTTENMLSTVRRRLKETYDEVLKLIHKTQESIRHLDEIALRKSDPDRDSSQVAYIDLLIESEKKSKKRGFEQRIESLRLLREKAKVKAEVAKGAKQEQKK